MINVLWAWEKVPTRPRKMMYYVTEDIHGNEIRTEFPCYSVHEAREWFIACGIYMAIDPQPEAA